MTINENEKVFFTGFLSLNFVNCYVHQLRMFIFCSITAFTNKLMVWPWVPSLVLFLPTFFLAHRERSWLANCNCNKSLYFSRYIDNCFVIFRSPNHVRPFQVYLKSQHPNISFTSELETNSKLLFLDILIDRSDDGFSTSVYRKPTFTGLFTTNFDSFIPISFKRSLIYTLLDRYFKICSSYYLFHSEVLKLKNILLSNGDPEVYFLIVASVFF